MTGTNSHIEETGHSVARAVLLCALLVLLPGCASKSPPQLPTRAVLGAAAGCAALRSDGLCELDADGDGRAAEAASKACRKAA